MMENHGGQEITEQCNKMEDLNWDKPPCTGLFLRDLRVLRG